MARPNENGGTYERRGSFAAYSLLLLLILIAFGLPILQSRYIYPGFVKQLIDNTEDEAVRTGKHMARRVLHNYSGSALHVSDELRSFFDQMARDFSLWKIKVFKSSGEIIYSTDVKDIGTINEKPYFHNVVAKGSTYTKVVSKNTESLEGQIVNSDVVETYVPIERDGGFLGAFELYYNITVQKDSLEGLVSQYTVLLYFLSTTIVIVAVIAFLAYRSSVKIREEFENTLLMMAVTDPLTGIYNRRGFEDLLNREYERSRRYQRSAGLLIFDLDHFKRINDTYGHQAGDEVLVEVAGRCAKLLRKSDILGRFGGEEFIVLLPETDGKSAHETAEKLRRGIEAEPFETGAGTIDVTISVGVASFNAKEEGSIEAITKRVDEALYTAKECGRNQVCFADADANR